jgi:hypothetical protein
MALRQFTPGDFLKLIAPEVLAELKPPDKLKAFTTNSDLIGGYVESAVRHLVRRYLHPIRVCTGGVIDQTIKPGGRDLPQIDSIAWIPAPVPAIFAVGDFAMVPRSSVLGVLEIKSSAYDIPGLVTQLDRIKTLVADAEAEIQDRNLALGVVCLVQENQRSSQLKRLREEGRVVAVFEESSGDNLAQTNDVYRFINFLAMLRWRAIKRDGMVGINLNVLADNGPT